MLLIRVLASVTYALQQARIFFHHMYLVEPEELAQRIQSLAVDDFDESQLKELMAAIPSDQEVCMCCFRINGTSISGNRGGGL